MSLFESLKSFFWQLPLLSDSKKEEVFFYLKGKIKGETKGVFSEDILGRYVAELLATQDFSNSFSIDYPRNSRIELTYIMKNGGDVALLNGLILQNLIPNMWDSISLDFPENWDFMIYGLRKIFIDKLSWRIFMESTAFLFIIIGLMGKDYSTYHLMSLSMTKQSIFHSIFVG